MRIIPLSQGKVALVDDCDYEELSKYKWYAHKNCNVWYAMRRYRREDGEQRGMNMHRHILGLKEGDGIIVDHKNLDGLDNRRENLRTCTIAQNGMNRRLDQRSKPKSSKYRGVIKCSHRKNLWQARIRQKNVGMFKSERDAAIAWNAAALKEFGEFARLNVVE